VVGAGSVSRRPLFQGIDGRTKSSICVEFPYYNIQTREHTAYAVVQAVQAHPSPWRPANCTTALIWPERANCEASHGKEHVRLCAVCGVTGSLPRLCVSTIPSSAASARHSQQAAAGAPIAVQIPRRWDNAIDRRARRLAAAADPPLARVL
jgi:hypothetical protein